MKVLLMRTPKIGVGYASLLFGALGCSAELGATDPEAIEMGSGAASSTGGEASPGGTDTITGGAVGEGGTGGQVQIPRDPDGLQLACDARSGSVSLGISKLRRLTRRQLDNTLVDLLDVRPGAASGLAPDERLGPFENNSVTPVTDLLVEQIQEMAKKVAGEVASRRIAIMGCDVTSEPDCVQTFVEDFGKMAFRRPLTDEEMARLADLFQLGLEGADADHGFGLLIQAFVQSPSFLHHVEVPSSNTATSIPATASPYTLASRLSYFLWNSMPDATLFELADSGALTEPSVLQQQVERMLADPRASQTLGVFHEQWLGITGLEEKTKDPEQFPAWGPELASSMLEETRRFSSYVVREGDGLLETLLTADFTLPDPNLLELYGVAPPAGFVIGDVVTVPNRAGLLTQPAFLTKNSHLDQTSVVHRGLVIRRNVLCQVIEPPPNNVSTSLPETSEATTTRERLNQHVAAPTCARCHQAIDPLGYAFENYDPIGAYRTQDGLGPVDASGEFFGTGEDLQGSYANALEMMDRMAQSAEVRNCVSDQWFRFAMGRMESLDDACTLLHLHQAFEDSGGNIRSLLTQIVSSESFLNVRSTTEVSQ